MPKRQAPNKTQMNNFKEILFRRLDLSSVGSALSGIWHLAFGVFSQ